MAYTTNEGSDEPMHLISLDKAFTARIHKVLRQYGPRREKTCLRGVRKSEIQTSLLSYKD